MAVKVVSKKSLNKSSMENLLTEIEILKTVRHPHIVQLKDFQVEAEMLSRTTFPASEVPHGFAIHIHAKRLPTRRNRTGSSERQILIQ